MRFNELKWHAKCPKMHCSEIWSDMCHMLKSRPDWSLYLLTHAHTRKSNLNLVCWHVWVQQQQQPPTQFNTLTNVWLHWDTRWMLFDFMVLQISRLYQHTEGVCMCVCTHSLMCVFELVLLQVLLRQISLSEPMWSRRKYTQVRDPSVISTAESSAQRWTIRISCWAETRSWWVFVCSMLLEMTAPISPQWVPLKSQNRSFVFQ